MRGRGGAGLQTLVPRLVHSFSSLGCCQREQWGTLDIPDPPTTVSPSVDIYKWGGGWMKVVVFKLCSLEPLWGLPCREAARPPYSPALPSLFPTNTY